MALHPEFPTSPYVVLEPEQRWFPADEALRVTAYDQVAAAACDKDPRSYVQCNT